MNTVGIIHRQETFPSRFISAHSVDVWLPPGYEDHGDRSPVMYMHDGQNLFDESISYGGVSWEINRAMTPLIAEGRIRFQQASKGFLEEHRRFVQLEFVFEKPGRGIEGVNRVTYKFEGAEHSEKSWRERVHIPLEFLMK